MGDAGALGRDGCIYLVTRDGRVLKINTTNNSHCFVGNSIESDHYLSGWGYSFLGDRWMHLLASYPCSPYSEV